MRGYPQRFLVALIGTFAAVWVSGMLLAPTTLALHAGVEAWWRLAAGARLGVVALHMAAALGLVFLCGALWSVHMRAGWRHRRQRGSGGTMAALLLLLASTALAILYAGSERLADAGALLHLGAGAAMVVPLAWHWRRAHLRRRGRRRAPTGAIRPASSIAGQRPG